MDESKHTNRKEIVTIILKLMFSEGNALTVAEEFEFEHPFPLSIVSALSTLVSQNSAAENKKKYSQNM